MNMDEWKRSFAILQKCQTTDVFVEKNWIASKHIGPTTQQVLVAQQCSNSHEATDVKPKKLIGYTCTHCGGSHLGIHCIDH